MVPWAAGLEDLGWYKVMLEFECGMPPNGHRKMVANHQHGLRNDRCVYVHVYVYVCVRVCARACMYARARILILVLHICPLERTYMENVCERSCCWWPIRYFARSDRRKAESADPLCLTTTPLFSTNPPIPPPLPPPLSSDLSPTMLSPSLSVYLWALLL